jgi:hypothetical protein
MSAGKLLRAALGWQQLYQYAIVARAWVFFATEVYASGGVFENKARPPSPARLHIPTLFKEIELVPKNFRQISLVFLHIRTPLEYGSPKYECSDLDHAAE